MCDIIFKKTMVRFVFKLVITLKLICLNDSNDIFFQFNEDSHYASNHADKINVLLKHLYNSGSKHILKYDFTPEVAECFIA